MMNHLKLLKNCSQKNHLNTVRFSCHKLFSLVEGVLSSFLMAWVWVFIGITASLLYVVEAEAWEIKTHRELTEKAIEFIASDLNGYLVDNVGLESGLDTSVDGMTPKQWMIEGSDSEDNFPRFLNHFHEPISNSGLGLSDSAIDWSLRSIGGQGDDAFSWNDAREFYFKALTSPTKEERDENWGKTFRALGQVMHLLQDSANPSHVRGDPHLLVDGLHDFMARRSVASYTGGGIFSPDPSILEQSGSAGPNGEPFANLFDRDTYQGSAPEVTLGTDIGVTEYTNANFFSDDTIPGQPPSLQPLSIFNLLIPDAPHPSLAELVPALQPSPYLTLPRLGGTSFPGARVAKYTGNETFAQFLNLEFDLLDQLRLDDAVYDAQAQHLIPRAVGYSAAVLTYFFRGDIQVDEGNTEFRLTGTVQPGGVCAPIPSMETGDLDVPYTIDSNLSFSGMESIYYERTDKTRVLLGGDPILHAQVPNPVRFYVVLEGQAGPGTQEPRAIVAKTGLAPWEFECII